jgi:spore germination protein GerM
LSTIKQETRVVKIKQAFSVAFMFLACLTLIPIANASPAAGQRRAPARKLVKVYFYHEPGEYIDLAPVKRYVSGATPARAAIQALLQGPTRDEERRGFEGIADEFRIGSLGIAGGTARINFVASRKWMGWAGDLAPIRFKKAVELTLKQFPNVQSVIVTLNGDPNFEQ